MRGGGGTHDGEVTHDGRVTRDGRVWLPIEHGVGNSRVAWLCDAGG